MATVVANFTRYNVETGGPSADSEWDFVESGTLQTSVALEVQNPWSVTLPVDAHLHASVRVNGNQQGTNGRSVTFTTAHFQRDGSGGAALMNQTGNGSSITAGQTVPALEANGNAVRLVITQPNNTTKMHWNWIVSYNLITPVYT